MRSTSGSAAAHRRHPILTVALAALALLATPATPAVPRAEATNPGGNGKILYNGSAAGSFDTSIWSMNANGTGRVQLTDYAEGVDSGGAWSPDGTKIAFSRRSDSDFVTDIWVMDADGTNETELGVGFSPAWSPDGTQLAFVFQESDVEFVIWKMNANGTGRTALTAATEAFAPDWSPDGSRIAFASGVGGIWTVKPDGTGETLVKQTTQVAAPRWSPDGKRIAFSDLTGPSTFEIFTIAATGGPVVNVTAAHTGLPPSIGGATYSPDGRRLVFTATPRTPTGGFGPSDIYTVNANGSGPLTNLSALSAQSERAVAWQPSPPYPFGDIATSTFLNDIIWMYERGITVGCTPHLFCPDATVTRGQMASFLVRALELPSTTTDYFTDDETSVHEADINAIRALGITAGCGPSRYCPLAALTRAEAAAFLGRAFGVLGTPDDFFTDDDDSPHEEYINALADGGLTVGCAPTKFCPDDLLTRGQMAAFLRRPLD